MTAFGFLRVAVDDPGHLLVENAVVDVGFLGVEIFVKRCPDDAVGINGHSELLGDLGQIGVVPAVASLVRENKQVAPIFDILLEILDFGGGEGIFGRGEDEELCFFDFIEIDGVLVKSNLHRRGRTL